MIVLDCCCCVDLKKKTSFSQGTPWTFEGLIALCPALCDCLLFKIGGWMYEHLPCSFFFPPYFPPPCSSPKLSYFSISPPFGCLTPVIVPGGTVKNVVSSFRFHFLFLVGCGV